MMNEIRAGTSGDDMITAGNNNNVIVGHDGNDIIYAGSGDDQIRGGNGNDKIKGKDGDDRLVGDSFVCKGEIGRSWVRSRYGQHYDWSRKRCNNSW